MSSTLPDTGLTLGIDICKDRLDLAYSDGQIPEAIAYDRNGLAKLVRLLAKRPVDLVIIESTGGIERPLISALLDAGIPLTRVQPGRVRHFAMAEGKMAKTDAIDAYLLAIFGQRISTRLLEKRSENQEELDALVTCRRQLIHVRTEQQNRRRTVTSKIACRSIDAVLRTVQKQIDQLDQQIRKLIDSDDDFRQTDRILRSVPGVAIGLSSLILSSFSELGTLDKREAAALVGVAPFNHDSGNRRKNGRIRGGRLNLRNGLYMSALSAMRCNPVIRVFAQRLQDAGKPFKVVVVACMRKLAGYLNVMLRDGLTWDQLAVVQQLKKA